MVQSLTIQDLITQLEQKLGLIWVGPVVGADGPEILASQKDDRPSLAGFLNIVHPNQVQVLGEAELDYLDSLDENVLNQTLQRLARSQTVMIVVGDGLEFPPRVLNAMSDSPAALMRSDVAANELVDYLRYFIARTLADRTTLHGVFMEVFTIGVHISGDSGCGKSELALELITRGHRLIADDAPEYTRITPEVIDGTCPEALQDCLEVRGLGILNIRQMFGDAAVKSNKFLRLIIHLELAGEDVPNPSLDRLKGDTGSQSVLGLDVPSITLPVRAGRNIAVMVEAAARDFMLKMKGIDASAQFLERYSRLLQRHDKET